ncbi:hypothetical protein QBC46DRAFT_383990 [Diplogelasinospora grovesii]|uniref:Uncharacterized protein n=1 Tax=Diplogelasinospora grovesii TaxID=303347 RepID=A0AAN6N9F0_9PEZI|nr:hypothetical protein QBC46DRAFT_383990 [Diplogelasinospora grovesii]
MLVVSLYPTLFIMWPHVMAYNLSKQRQGSRLRSVIYTDMKGKRKVDYGGRANTQTLESGLGRGRELQLCLDLARKVFELCIYGTKSLKKEKKGGLEALNIALIYIQRR